MRACPLFGQRGTFGLLPGGLDRLVDDRRILLVEQPSQLCFGGATLLFGGAAFGPLIAPLGNLDRLPGIRTFFAVPVYEST